MLGKVLKWFLVWWFGYRTYRTHMLNWFDEYMNFKCNKRNDLGYPQRYCFHRILSPFPLHISWISHLVFLLLKFCFHNKIYFCCCRLRIELEDDIVFRNSLGFPFRHCTKYRTKYQYIQLNIEYSLLLISKQAIFAIFYIESPIYRPTDRPTKGTNEKLNQNRDFVFSFFGEKIVNKKRSLLLHQKAIYWTKNNMKNFMRFL